MAKLVYFSAEFPDHDQYIIFLIDEQADSIYL